jgi:hypothetical protein
MACRLLVILGAGASYDCATGDGGRLHEELRPPLVTQLFESRHAFTGILQNYPLAQKAAAEIRPAITRGSVAIEAFLKQHLRESEFEHSRRQYWAIPLYLQQLLFEVSRWQYDTGRGYAEQPDCYDRLINAALRVDEVTFVSLNYDDIFDQRLFVYDTNDSLESYLGAGKNWALIKLHGSINWGRRVLNGPLRGLSEADDPLLSRTFAGLGGEIEFAGEIELRPQPTVRGMRIDVGPNSDELFFPALSAPLGAEDDLVCPPPHVEYLRNITGHHDPLDVLVIGYSGLDQEVLKQLNWGERAIRSLYVVSENDEHANETAERIASSVRIAPPIGVDAITLRTEGFTNFAQSTHLDDYVTLIRKVAVQEDERTDQLRAGQLPTT